MNMSGTGSSAVAVDESPPDRVDGIAVRRMAFDAAPFPGAFLEAWRLPSS